MTQTELRDPRAADAMGRVNSKTRPRRAASWGALASVVIAGSGPLAGCALDVESANGDVESVSSRPEELILLGQNSACPWERWPRDGDEYPIELCFYDWPLDSSHPSLDPAGDRAMFMDALEETWEKYSGVRFINGGNCPNPPAQAPPGVVTVCLHYDHDRPAGDAAVNRGQMPFDTAPSSGMANAGSGSQNGERRACGTVGTDSMCQVHVEYPADYMSYKAALVHEVGHVLGMWHEDTHPGWPADGCDIVPGGYWWYTESVDPINGGFGTPNGGCPPASVSPACAGPILTDFVDFDSVMSCFSCSKLRIHDDQDWFYLSPGDKLGIGMVWPKANNPPLGSSTGFYGYGGLLVRWSSTVTTWWTLMGANNDVLTGDGNLPLWTHSPAGQPGTWNNKGRRYDLPASLLGSGRGDLKVDYVDFWSRSWSSTTSVMVDNPKHGAVVTAAVL